MCWLFLLKLTETVKQNQQNNKHPKKKKKLYVNRVTAKFYNSTRMKIKEKYHLHLLIQKE